MGTACVSADRRPSSGAQGDIRSPACEKTSLELLLRDVVSLFASTGRVPRCRSSLQASSLPQLAVCRTSSALRTLWGAESSLKMCRPLHTCSSQAGPCTQILLSRSQVLLTAEGVHNHGRSLFVQLLTGMWHTGCHELLSGAESTLLGVTPADLLRAPCGEPAELHVRACRQTQSAQGKPGHVFVTLCGAQDLGLQLLPELELQLARQSRALADTCGLPGQLGTPLMLDME